ncbi:DUF1127 domain-containing protein [uncultured Roseobacter sp.]|uniref:DUF1127 domain-containing protein n=1 Tax=uncultured Roseobacter sp. TaxID=114847 RepID=UPI002613C5FE|nr:DUF1127 domain-containing protein [uncultured Roseobacter sp.]
MTQDMTLSPRTLDYLNHTRSVPVLSILAVEFAVCLSKWATRRRTRKALKQLSTWQLADVGLTPAEADTEASKVFWRA